MLNALSSGMPEVSSVEISCVKNRTSLRPDPNDGMANSKPVDF